MATKRFDECYARLAQHLFSHNDISIAEMESDPILGCAFITEFAPQSQFDILAAFMRENLDFADGILCLAGSGNNFKGQHRRNWVSLAGNIHLSLYLNPAQAIEKFNIGFSILPAVAVLQAIDACKGLRQKAAIKWVNDILIGDAKVAGVLTKTQVLGQKVTAVILGIGINIETQPGFVPDLVVPRADCLHSFVEQKNKCSQQIVLYNLLQMIAANYRRLLQGGYADLLDFYRRRSAIIGKRIVVLSDPVDAEPEKITEGIVLSIGENLELLLENHDTPIIHGRVALID